MAEDDYHVGYGKPPKTTRFRAGKSGNPKGRPIGAKSLSNLVRQELDRRTEVTIAGQRRRLPNREIMVRRWAELALKGDQKAMQILAKLDEAGGGGTVAGQGPGATYFNDISDERCEEILRALIARKAPEDG
jgi:hypothetical protein